MSEKKSESKSGPMSNEEAVEYLSSFMGKSILITTTDERRFFGTMKCTDRDRNIILNVTHEYREPLAADVEAAAKKTAKTGSESYKLPMTSRFVGQVVIPGQHIVKIEEVRSGN